jgi:hypothetical protein
MQLVKDFKEVEAKDVEFSQWLKKQGWEGDVNKVGDFTQFILPDETIIAVVKYRNQAPCNRWIYIPENMDIN